VLREPLAKLNEVMAVGTKPIRRQMIDYRHVVAAVIHNVAAFVTFDRGIVKRREEIQLATGLRVLDPSEALHLAH
jgi:hypothetical protein